MRAIVQHKDKTDLEKTTAFGERNGLAVTDTGKTEAAGEDYGAWPTKISYVNGVPIIKRDPSITIDDMAGAFTDMGIDVDELRKSIRRKRA